MRYQLKYILLFLFFVGFTLPLSADDSLSEEKDSITKEIVHAFYTSMGFQYLTLEETATLPLDTILDYLEATKQYNYYFALERIMIKSYLAHGDICLAIDQSEQMYSKASVLSHRLGIALALNAMAEVYGCTDRFKEAGKMYEYALELYEELKVEEWCIRILLLELVEYNLRMPDFVKAAYYLERLNHYSAEQLTVQEQAVRHIFNSYYEFMDGDIDSGYLYLREVDFLRAGLSPSILQHLLIAYAMYWTRVGEYEKALEAYDDFFNSTYEIHASLYKELLQGKAQLLLKMGHKQEAYKQYEFLLSYIESSFETHYQKEIDQLRTRFQADELTYQNRHARLLSYRLYIGGCIVCFLLLLLFIYIGWRRIYRLRESKKHQEVMIQKVEYAIKRKQLFLSNMSHEVRTPLNAIVGFSGILVSEDCFDDDDSRREFCQIIKVNSFQLLNLINDILDFSDFSDDNVRFDIHSCDVVKLCREVVETVLASCTIEVDLRFETDLKELFVETDNNRLRQVLINLLVNATKFTEVGSIILKLERKDIDTAFFSVTDTGCGIPLEKQPKIFERFEKVNDFAQGTGLGLSICQLIVNYMNGQIWIDSSYTEGARFCFTHPLKYVKKKEEAVS